MLGKHFGIKSDSDVFEHIYMDLTQRILGADYMRAGPVSRAGSVCRDLGTSVKHIKNQLCDYVEKSQPG